MESFWVQRDKGLCFAFFSRIASWCACFPNGYKEIEENPVSETRGCSPIPTRWPRFVCSVSPHGKAWRQQKNV